MSLFGTLQIANNALIAQQLGLQVVGNNIANANTPGYVREELLLSPAPTQQYGGILVGLGVQVDGIRQKVDRFLDERLRNANAELANSQSQDNTYVQLESVLGELNDTDLSSMMSKFFGSLHDVLNQPESLSIRNVAIQQGQRLADDIQHLDSRVRLIRSQINTSVMGAATDINRLTSQIADLNVKIATFEGGGAVFSDAVGLRDQRTQLVNELARLINVKTFEQQSGALSISAGGDYLVNDGTSRKVIIAPGDVGGSNAVELRLADTDARLEIGSGQIAGLVTSRDGILNGFLEKLDSLTKTMTFEFNKIYAGGQGLSGYTDVTSEFSVKDNSAALDAAGLTFTPVNGSFQLQVYNKQTNITKTTNVLVKLNGLDDDTTLSDLAAALNAIDGVSASVTADNKLKINSDSQNLEFAFANDTSGVLAALGVNTFFSGSTSNDIGVNKVLLNDPSKLATSRGGVGADTNNMQVLAAFNDMPLLSKSGQSLANLYDNFVTNLSQAAAATRSLKDGYSAFHDTLESQQMAVSGVSLDEEAVKMLSYQRAYQASARFIKTIDELLTTLVNL